MKKNQFYFLIASFTLLMLGCSTEDYELQKLTQSALNPALEESNQKANKGATQISGVGYFAAASDCDWTSQGAEFALHLTGDLEGCLFVFVESYDCSPSGTYREQGEEYFVGTYKGETGTFRTSYRFEAKYEGCSEDGFFLGAEIFGRCQHPIQAGTGTGVFAGVSGRLDFKDNVETGALPFRGHLRY